MLPIVECLLRTSKKVHHNNHISFGLEVIVLILSKLILLSQDLNAGKSKFLNLGTVTIFDMLLTLGIRMVLTA